ncbi:MAG: sodium-dependent transporter [Gammaproteobacteria bacterium]|jgi:NSS family neurotransmitter:Na+ symporter|nr:sodium-dependent transporter [Gammaproteobacteria bacterium]
MAATRGEFSSRFGFVMAAAGSAVGLGNIWGFPTQAASNGGAAFLLVYLALAFTLAYPVLMVELVIGRYAHANAVNALRRISPSAAIGRIGAGVGIAGVVVASLILSFYAIVAGWMIAFGLASVMALMGQHGAAAWLTSFSFSSNVLFMLLFMSLTIGIISAGVSNGIERWSARLMPVLIATLVALVVYVMTLDGAMDGLKVYLLPDFERALSPKLIVAALGAAFFSLSLGVGTMLIYGSYINDNENLPVVGGLVTLVDIMIAVTAGFLVLPAMYVALHNGVEIFTATGQLISEDTLIFTVLPELFATMGIAGIVVSITFFALMSIAALTSSISMLEVPVAYAIEEHNLPRKKAVLVIGGLIALASLTILLNFEALFGFVITFTTRYSQPLLGLALCIFTGWLWHRNTVLKELQKGAPDVAAGWFWKIWPWYIKFFCPVIILAIFAQSIWG